MTVAPRRCSGIVGAEVRGGWTLRKPHRVVVCLGDQTVNGCSGIICSQRLKIVHFTVVNTTRYRHRKSCHLVSRQGQSSSLDKHTGSSPRRNETQHEIPEAQENARASEWHSVAGRNTPPSKPQSTVPYNERPSTRQNT